MTEQFAIDPVSRRAFLRGAGALVVSFSLLRSAMGQEIIPIPVLHGRLPISGYRIGKLAYITDAKTIPEESLDLLQGLDVLVLNGLREREHPTHLSFGEAIAVIERLAPRHAYLVHLSHETSHQQAQNLLPNGIDIAWDGLTVTYADSD